MLLSFHYINPQGQTLLYWSSIGTRRFAPGLSLAHTI